MKRLALASMLLLVAANGLATTWHVAKDGTGDFVVIQHAIDAASPGDTIWIHAGRYEELLVDFDLWDNGTVFVDAHAAVTVDNLTLQGDGADVTIIGPEEYPENPAPIYLGIGVSHPYADTLTIRDLTVENTQFGVYAASQTCSITRCRIEGASDSGVRLATSTRCEIEDCDFLSSQRGVQAFSPTGHVSIRGSRFLDSGYKGVVGAGAETMEITDCEFTGGAGAVDFQQGTSALVLRISATEYSQIGAVLYPGGTAEIYDSVFEGGLGGLFSSGTRAICERTSFSNHSDIAIRINNSGESYFHDCEFINGGGLTVKCIYNGSDDCHVDMTNNYWGTDSEAQIAEWIEDNIDVPGDCCIVDFIPFQGVVVTEPHSWSSVKGLFEGGGE